jgi:NhaA family Na+:H+ antiporter
MKVLNPKNIFSFFIKEETKSSTFLVLAGIIGLTLANSSLSNQYFNLLNLDITVGLITMDVQHWINEGLMAFFFLVVSLEIKREMIDGELKGWKKASFPVFAALGGMILPALIFTLLNPKSPENNGWAIPMATDIAIAIGVIGLLGNRITKSLRLFLLTLAIVDDIGSILVIGLFYSRPDNMFAFLLAVLFFMIIAVMRKSEYWIMWFGILGFVAWYLLIISGVPGTIAGVIVAFLAPLSTRRRGSKKLQMSEVAEDILLPLTSYIIVPLFVFANAGIKFSSIEINDKSSFSVFAGIVLGLVFGKSIGIIAGAKISTLLKISKKPNTLYWRQIYGVGYIAGIGFTISLLISSLAYENYPNLKNAATAGIFVASIISGSIGLFLLSRRKTFSK